MPNFVVMRQKSWTAFFATPYNQGMAKAIFVTIRTGSSRLPQKALAPVTSGKMALEFILERVSNSKVADLVVVCTTELPEDDIIEEIGLASGIRVFRGSVEDKLDRWWRATQENGVSSFVTADGDDLFCDPGLLDDGLRMLSDGDVDFIEAPDAPCGAFTYGIKTEALARVCEIKKSSDTEMMWVYFKDTNLFKVEQLVIDSSIRRPEYRLTLDYQEDLDFFRRVIDHFDGRSDMSILEIVQFLDSHPDVVAINAFRQEEFLENQRRRTHLEV
jgi:spore coat polysaccharide biosynthesis protein SpsF